MEEQRGGGAINKRFIVGALLMFHFYEAAANSKQIKQPCRQCLRTQIHIYMYACMYIATVKE